LKKQRYTSLIDDIDAVSTQAEDITLIDRTHNLIQLKKQFIPRTPKQKFSDPYFFIKAPSKNMGTVNWDHFNSGMNISGVPLVPQMKHFERHLA